ncbi:thioredoxin domain-containing protein [Gloeocapsa sp. PCC 73106]|uniref:thioredoxin domain-containing protein n=1 Tax=Gloeocapsa sp. PCC 73106 TaxID=102232 RepID=UPI0002ABCD62|nr:thioredoxin domain-containing protein [Gloeocapsa sp. PCC 73106]ELR98158.1 thioredoxin domain containing protein [Gloeocapsa sp. PCC 73106]
MPNRLAKVKSLYLRKHAENPIDWWYWCEEAIATAKADNKPIFLSIGYSSCHWCTVMEGEAFSDQAIADYLNENFLPIKVDREERPDIDSIYMQALQMISGQGGWPLNIFLTPDDLIPFYGGTYFPVEPRYGRPGFLDVLRSLRHFYDQEKSKLNSIKDQVRSGLEQSTMLNVVEPNHLINKELLYKGIETNTSVISRNSPGSPSFPMIPYADLALKGSYLKFNSRYDGRELAKQRGKDLALGGICDHVGGGFHRYTVDPTWTVPHFEKMLYDNGLIVEYLANLWSGGISEPSFERAIALTVQWLKREMTAPESYFYAAQDADSFPTSDALEPEEGAFYVWNYSELESLLTPYELNQLGAEFTVSSEGNFEGSNVLQRRQSGKLSSSLETILAKLFETRYGRSSKEIDCFPPARNNQEAKFLSWEGRIPAVTDTKMIVAWNSLMISGLARAYAVFSEPSYWDLAVGATKFILNNQWVEGRFQRLNYDGEAAVPAQAEDYTLFIKALLDLYAAKPEETNWLDRALAVQQELDRLFWCSDSGGYYNNGSDNGATLPLRERSYNDNAIPSANGVAIANLVRLSLLTDNLEHLDRAQEILAIFGNVLQKYPQTCPSLVTGLYWYLHPISVRATLNQLGELISQYFPTTAFILDPELPENYLGLVCKGLACQKPATTQAELLEQIRASLQ